MTEKIVDGEAGETRQQQNTPHFPGGQAKSQLIDRRPSREAPLTPADREDGPAHGAPLVDGEQGASAEVCCAASAHGTAEFFKTEDIATFSVYQSVAGLTEKSAPETWDMMTRIVAANRAVLDSAEALLNRKLATGGAHV
jgi:hypothetical protein